MKHIFTFSTPGTFLSMIKALVTGATGSVGHYLIPALANDRFDVVATGRADFGSLNQGHPWASLPHVTYKRLDFTDPYAVDSMMEEERPDVIIHAGAMSKPDDCEQHQWEAYFTNVEATMQLAMSAEENGSFFIFLSTDFVFDGKKGMYTETDEPSPINFYGRTKLEAEQAVSEFAGDWAIVRTVAVFGKPVEGKRQFLSQVKDHLERGEAYHAVTDQVRTPTYAGDLAKALAIIARNKYQGIIHVAGGEVATPFELATKLAAHLELDSTLLKPLSNDQLLSAAQRPLRTGLDITKARALFNYQPLTIDEALAISYPKQ
jgi:dTDP-4-dehydrorhamnose reductase